MTVQDITAEKAPPQLTLDGTAVFLDLDGTLAPIAARPDDVGPDPRRSRLLERLGQALGGRLAIVSGRTLGEVDRILEGRVPAVAAVHGLVRRDADGALHQSEPHPALARAGERLRELARGAEGLLVEDKRLSVTLHYRLAPEQGRAIRAAAEALAADTGLVLQLGDMVVELRTPGPTKGDSVRRFMAGHPFAGARPVFVGDDLTDEDGFAAAADLGGYGVLVGPERASAARWRISDVGAVLRWLEAAS